MFKRYNINKFNNINKFIQKLEKDTNFIWILRSKVCNLFGIKKDVETELKRWYKLSCIHCYEKGVLNQLRYIETEKLIASIFLVFIVY